MMKKFLLAAVSLISMGITVPASAADLPAKAPPPPMLPPMYSWSGFYIGGNGGWAESHNCWDFLPITGALLSDGCRDRSGGTAGGQIGYRWQANQWIFGLEAQGNWADISSSRISLIDPAFSTRTQMDGIGLFTAQLGYAWNAVLLYVKGGAAVTNTDFSIRSTIGDVELASASASRWGGTVGVGLEYGFAPNWSFGVEYDHLFMGDANSSFVNPVINPILANATSRISQDVDMVTFRLNYRFGWGTTNPVLARY